MSRSTNWKEHERRTARRLSGIRNGNRGTAASDVTAGRWAVECKSRKELPGWLLGAMAQAARNAEPGQMGIVILHEVGQRSDNDLVVLRLADFASITNQQEPTE